MKSVTARRAHAKRLTLLGCLAGIGMATIAAPGVTQAGAVLDQIVADKVIRLGIRTDAPPFAVLKGDRLSGFSVDLCAMVANTIVDTSGLEGLTGKVVQVTASDRFEKLQSGEIDVLCGATSATLSRREIVSFSIPTFLTGVGAAVRADASDLLKEVLIQQGPAAHSKAAIEAALKGMTVGVHKSTTAEDWLTSGPISTIGGMRVERVDDHGRGFDLLATGRIDAYFADHAILNGYRHERQLADILISQDTYTLEPLALGLPRGDEALRLMIDRALSHLYRSGKIFKVFETHFGKPKADVQRFYGSVSLPD